MAAPSATSAPGPLPAVPEASFRFTSVSPEDQALIRAGAELAARYLATSTGVSVRRATVFASSNIEALANQFEANPGWSTPSGPEFARRVRFAIAEVNQDSVFVYTAAPLWLSLPGAQRSRVVAHEYVHLLQFELLGPDLSGRVYITPSASPRTEGPTWLFEGLADLLSWRAFDAAGLGSVAAEVASLGANLRDSRLSPPGMETYLDYLGGGPDSIGISLLAAEYLLRGKGEAGVVRYYRRVRDGVSWQQAFGESFGETVESFYARFQKYQQAGFRSGP